MMPTYSLLDLVTYFPYVVLLILIYKVEPQLREKALSGHGRVKTAALVAYFVVVLAATAVFIVAWLDWRERSERGYFIRGTLDIEKRQASDAVELADIGGAYLYVRRTRPSAEMEWRLELPSRPTALKRFSLFLMNGDVPVLRCPFEYDPIKNLKTTEFFLQLSREKKKILILSDLGTTQSDCSDAGPVATNKAPLAMFGNSHRAAAGFEFISSAYAGDLPSQETNVDTSQVQLKGGISSSWRMGYNGRRLRELHDSAKWSDLYSQIVDIGETSDLSYYYLARATEGLGQLETARKYYAQAIAADFKCDGLLNVCNGIDVRAASRTGIERIDLKTKDANDHPVSQKSPVISEDGSKAGTTNAASGDDRNTRR